MGAGPPRWGFPRRPNLGSVPNSDTLFVWGSQFGWPSKSGCALLTCHPKADVPCLHVQIKKFSEHTDISMVPGVTRVHVICPVRVLPADKALCRTDLQFTADISDISTTTNLFPLLLPQNSSVSHEIKCIGITFNSRLKLAD